MPYPELKNLSKKAERMFFRKIILLIPALLLCYFPSMAAAEEGVAAAPGGAGSQTSLCRDLKPYNNLDELLYQFYINLDSDCLFEMPTAELEKIWDTKILDEERAKPKNYYLSSQAYFYFKPYKSEKDAFYLERSYDTFFKRNLFIINATKAYSDKHPHSLFGEHLPKSLPKPRLHLETFVGPPSCNFNDLFYGAKPLYDDGSTLLHEPSGEPTIIYMPHKNTKCYAWWPKGGNRHTASILLVNSSRALIAGNHHKKKYAKLDENVVIAQQAALDVKKNARSSSDIKSDACRGLKPINNIDELLYQIYINLDNDCLTTKSVKELEAIWGIKIFSSNAIPRHLLHPFYFGEALKYTAFAVRPPNKRHHLDYYGKPYKTKKDAFVLEYNYPTPPSKFFHMTIENADEYRQKHGTLFYDGSFPKMLPYPDIHYKRWDSNGGSYIRNYKIPEIDKIIPENNSEYLFGTFNYKWLNSDKTRHIDVEGDISGKVTRVSIGGKQLIESNSVK